MNALKRWNRLSGFANTEAQQNAAGDVTSQALVVKDALSTITVKR